MVSKTWFEDNKNHQYMMPHPVRDVAVMEHFCRHCNRPTPKLYKCQNCPKLLSVTEIDEHERNCGTAIASNSPKQRCSKQASETIVNPGTTTSEEANVSIQLLLPCGRVGVPIEQVPANWFEVKKPMNGCNLTHLER